MTTTPPASTLSEYSKKLADKLMAIIDEAPDLSKALELEDVTLIKD